MIELDISHINFVGTCDGSEKVCTGNEIYRETTFRKVMLEAIRRDMGGRRDKGSSSRSVAPEYRPVCEVEESKLQEFRSLTWEQRGLEGRSDRWLIPEGRVRRLIIGYDKSPCAYDKAAMSFSTDARG